MNNFRGTITAIEQDENLALVRIGVGEVCFTTIVIDSPETASYLKRGRPVRVLFKETEVLIGKNQEEGTLSVQNKIGCTIQEIEEGKLLSRLVLESSIGRVIAIVTTYAAHQLALKKGDAVAAMVKTNEIMLAE